MPGAAPLGAALTGLGSLPLVDDGREFLAELQHLPRDAEVLAFEAGREEYCEREIDDYLAS
jgi:hypothetical protein